MKPIEEGCKAVIVGCKKDLGKIVVVGKYIGINEVTSDTELWEIDRPVSYQNSGHEYFISEYYLKRIDDEDTTTWEHVAETIGFIPNKQLVEQE